MFIVNPDAARSVEEKKRFLEQFFEANAKFKADFSSIWNTVLPDMILKKWNVFGEDMGLVFLSHNGLSGLQSNFEFFRKNSFGRFTKSFLVNWATHEIVSIGLPMMASVTSRIPEVAQVLSTYSTPTFIEKLDGVCLLATRVKGGYIIKSRRSIYYAQESLNDLLGIKEYEFGRHIQELIDGEWEKLGPFTVSFECLFPHPYFFPCHNADFASLLGSSKHFTPYVCYNNEGAFLTSIVRHDGSFVSQSETDRLATKYGLLRPRTFTFNSTDEASLFLKQKVNHEGFIVYVDEDQTPLKWKTSWWKNVNRVSAGFYQLNQLTRNNTGAELLSREIVNSNVRGLGM